MQCDPLNCNQLAQDRVQQRVSKLGNKISVFVKAEKFLNQLKYYQPVKEKSQP